MRTPSDTSTLTKTYSKSWTMTLQPLHWAFMAFYAKRRNKSRSETLRELIQAVVERDRTFDAKAFKRFVMKELINEESDAEARDVLRAQVDQFVKEWAKAHNTTK